jgi:hypothetical protein
MLPQAQLQNLLDMFVASRKYLIDSIERADTLVTTGVIEQGKLKVLGSPAIPQLRRMNKQQGRNRFREAMREEKGMD